MVFGGVSGAVPVSGCSAALPQVTSGVGVVGRRDRLSELKGSLVGKFSDSGKLLYRCQKKSGTTPVVAKNTDRALTDRVKASFVTREDS